MACRIRTAQWHVLFNALPQQNEQMRRGSLGHEGIRRGTGERKGQWDSFGERVMCKLSCSTTTEGITYSNNIKANSVSLNTGRIEEQRVYSRMESGDGATPMYRDSQGRRAPETSAIFSSAVAHQCSQVSRSRENIVNVTHIFRSELEVEDSGIVILVLRDS